MKWLIFKIYNQNSQLKRLKIQQKKDKNKSKVKKKLIFDVVICSFRKIFLASDCPHAGDDTLRRPTIERAYNVKYSTILQ